MSAPNAYEVLDKYLELERGLPIDIRRKFIRILELEDSFSIGRKEVFSNNLDFAFRWLYLLAFILLLSVQISNLYKEFTIFGAGVCFGCFFLLSFFYLIITYRMKQSNLSRGQSVLFYFRCKCFKTKQRLENY